MTAKTKLRLKRVGEDFFHSALEFIKSAAITTIIILILTRVFFLNAIIPSGSMEPTLPVGGVMICLRTDYWFDRPKQGEIIVFTRNAEDDKTAYTKRVVGAPGDIVQIRSGVTYVNAKKYDEPWLAETPQNLDFGPYIVPAGKYFCMGDNRNYSTDCRYWKETFVEEDRVLARGRIGISIPFKVQIFNYQQGGESEL